ncbi:MAG TPA: hypothetical protein DIS90_14670 [Cytophagales bacterium]|nr:hypothetical protein [Cytophagales bacterium]HCR53957.1 hypothetical protein [Cytophagales bacterium]
MKTFTPLEFHKARDFSKKINDTFEFLKQNFKPLTKSVLFIAGPPVLMGSLLMGSFIGDFFNFSQSSYTGSSEAMEKYFLSLNFWLQIIFALVFLLVSGVASMATINNYIILYGEKKSNQIEINEVWERVKSTFWMYLGTMLFFAILFILAYMLMLIPMVLLSTISPFLIVFGVIGIIVVLFYLIFGASLTFFIRAYEKSGFFPALSRSFNLVRGKWWSTFGLIMVLSLIVSTLSYLFIMPWYITTIISAMHNVSTDIFQEPSFKWKLFTILSFAVYYLSQMVLSAIPNIGIALQYFNLVELKEAKGLMNEIESLGKPLDSSTERKEDF